MKEIIGKWMLDVAKYIATALILSRAFMSTGDTVAYYVTSFALFASILSCGLLLLWLSRKSNNSNNQ